MDRFCSKCGAVLNQNNGRCPVCQPAVSDSSATQKKTPKPKNVILVASVLLFLAGIVVIFAVVFSSKNSEEKNLKSKLGNFTEKKIAEFYYDDFNSDGIGEAFAVVSNDKEKDCYRDAEIWYVSTGKVEMITPAEMTRANGLIHDNKQTYVSIEILQADTHRSYIYGSTAPDEYYEPDFSRKYSDVHQDGDNIAAVDENGNAVMVFDSTRPAEEFLEATDADFKHLEEVAELFLFNNNFDCEKNDMGYAVSAVMDFFINLYPDYTGENVEIDFDNIDPLKRVTKEQSSSEDYYDANWSGFSRAKAEKVEWIIKNILNIEIDRNYQSNKTYYHDGYYYCDNAIGGMEELYIHKVDSSEKLDDGKYKIKLKLYVQSYDNNPKYFGEEELIAALKNIDGKREWSFYKITSNNN